MFAPEGPTVRELAGQALSSVEHGYDLLAPKFDLTPFRTPDAILDAVAHALRPLGPFGHGLDLCCGTGAGMGVLARVCRGRVTGVDISAGMLARGRATWTRARQEPAPPGRPAVGTRTARTLTQAAWPAAATRTAPSARPGQECPDRPVPASAFSISPGRGRTPPSGPAAGEAGSAEVAGGAGPADAAPVGRAPSAAPAPDWVRADALALPFGPVFDLVVSFGAFGHFLPGQRPALFDQVRRVLRPGGRFVFPMPAPVGPAAWVYWLLLGFDTAMRVRNALWRPPFVMYYRTFPPARVHRELTAAGFDVTLRALPELGLRRDGSPRCGMIVATRSDGR